LPIKYLFFTSVAHPGPASGIRCLFDPWIRDPGLVKNQDPGSGLKTSRIMFQELRNNFWVKILEFFDADLDLASGIFLNLDPGWKNSDPGSGINIPDPQHCFLPFSFSWVFIFENLSVF
jgi:hypothetical protein